MSILDFTTDLFRDPANLRAFIEDGNQALKDAGLPDATPEQVADLLPVVAESMPAEHPLQTVAHAPDPQAALQELDLDHIEELASQADAHHHHKARLEDVMDDPSEDSEDKAISTVDAPVGDHAGDAVGDEICVPDAADDHELIVETMQIGKWKVVTTEDGKGLGDATDIGEALAQGDFVMIVDDPMTPEIEVEIYESDDHHALDQHALDEDVDDPEGSAALWGKAIDS